MAAEIEKNIDIKEITEIVTPFDEFEYEPLLNEIQGNILKPHGRNHAVYLFLKFNQDIERAKQWIGRFSHRYVTSALEQAEQAKLYRQNKDVPGKLFANFFLTSAGYLHLGYPYEQLPNEDGFRQGMQDPNMQNELGDDKKDWHDEFQHEFHAMVLLAADKIVGPRTKEAKLEEQKNQATLPQLPALLRRTVEKIKNEIIPIVDFSYEQTGYVLRDQETGEEIEHFGFRDGVSQPLFLKRDIDKERKDSDFSQWDPRAPLSLVLFKDPLGKKDESYGSFLVFRKLEQNVGGWNRDVVRLARKLNILDEKIYPIEEREPRREESLQEWMNRLKLSKELREKIALVEAYSMGRFRDGKPVVLSSEPSPDPKKYHPEDNFNYNHDVEGSKCPFFAHTRKVNPRGDTANPELLPTPTDFEQERMHRIARRGIVYGPVRDEQGQIPEGDAGLLFMCFQASLASQFNFMQKAWAKEQHFIKRDVGTDPVIGVEKRDANGRAPTEKYNWPTTNWGNSERKEVEFRHWVTMRGGEFFFAPSMSFLKSLADEPSRNIVFRGIPRKEIEATQQIITELRDYKQKNWAIGLNGDTTQPDQFLTFFNQRNLPFEFYLRNQAPLGDSSAYDKNIATLNKYIEDVINQEIDACEYKIAEFEEYKGLNWAVGLNGDTLQPDGFVNFFGERELSFEFYVRTGISVGDPSAYDKNIKTLNDYITTLNK